MGSWIELTAADGHRLDAFRADPSGDAREPRGAVVIVQEVFGVNHHVRALVDEYAAEGYVAVAPALFDRVTKHVDLDYTPEGTAQGRALRGQIGWDKPLLDVEAAARSVADRGRVATLGFCWGGSLSFLSACRASGLACAVAYYGAQIIQFVDERPRVPVLIHFGQRDALIPAVDRERIAAAHPEAEIHVYPAGHGFNCTERPDHEPASASLAKERTLAFLRAHVG